MEIQRLTSLLSLDPVLTQSNQAKPEQVSGNISFPEMFERALQQVEQDQHYANEMALRTATGNIEDIAAANIASERATLSLSLAIQVRNKVIEAYQEIMRMPL